MADILAAYLHAKNHAYGAQRKREVASRSARSKRGWRARKRMTVARETSLRYRP